MIAAYTDADGQDCEWSWTAVQHYHVEDHGEAVDDECAYCAVHGARFNLTEECPEVADG